MGRERARAPRGRTARSVWQTPGLADGCDGPDRWACLRRLRARSGGPERTARGLLVPSRGGRHTEALAVASNAGGHAACPAPTRNDEDPADADTLRQEVQLVPPLIAVFVVGRMARGVPVERAVRTGTTDALAVVGLVVVNGIGIAIVEVVAIVLVILPTEVAIVPIVIVVVGHVAGQYGRMSRD